MNGPLLDSNVLIAASFPEHEHFAPADAWLARQEEFAVCPITEGALVRFALRIGVHGGVVRELLEGLHAVPAFRFIAASTSYRAVDLAVLRGHRQATDAYLLRLAEESDRRLATFDHALATSAPERTVVPGRAA